MTGNGRVFRSVYRAGESASPASGDLLPDNKCAVVNWRSMVAGSTRDLCVTHIGAFSAAAGHLFSAPAGARHDDPAVMIEAPSLRVGLGRGLISRLQRF